MSLLKRTLQHLHSLDESKMEGSTGTYGSLGYSLGQRKADIVREYQLLSSKESRWWFGFRVVLGQILSNFGTPVVELMMPIHVWVILDRPLICSKLSLFECFPFNLQAKRNEINLCFTIELKIGNRIIMVQ